MNIFHKIFFEMEEHHHPNERSFELLKTFHEHFPSEVAQLFRYSRLDNSFSGVLQYQNLKVNSLQHIHEYMKMNEHIHRHLKDNKVKLFRGNRLQISIGGQFLAPVVIEDFFLIPISINDVVIAFFTGLNTDFKLSDQMMDKENDFRFAVSEVLTEGKTMDKDNFSNKEIIILNYIALGYSTKEIAESMNFSEANIKYFIKNVMDKTNSKNRTEAVAKLFRLGILS